MDIFDSGPSSQQNNVAVPKNLNDLDILGDNNQNNMANTDLLGSPLQQQNNIIFNNNANVNSSNNNDLLGGVMDLQVQAEPPKKSVLNDLESAQFGGLDLLGTNQTVSNSSQGKFSMSAYSDNAIEILFDCQMTSSDTTKIETTFKNLTGHEIRDVKMQIAVKKYLKLTLNQPNSDHMAPFSSNDLKQNMTIQNSSQGEKPIS